MNKIIQLKNWAGILLLLSAFTACDRIIETSPDLTNELEAINQQEILQQNDSSGKTILLVIDDESIDDDEKPNYFSERDINYNIAAVGQRAQLHYFKNNVGKSIVLYTGEVGDEGWYALKTIPASWRNAGPTSNGAANFVAAGSGLGSGNDKEKWLDKIPGVTPLRATGLRMLVGQTILAVVYESDISINYSPLNGSLKGENMGLVALQVTKIARRTDGSSESLPAVTVKILDAEQIKKRPLFLFSNAPAPRSSSEPYDINPPASAAGIALVKAN